METKLETAKRVIKNYKTDERHIFAKIVLFPDDKLDTLYNADGLKIQVCPLWHYFVVSGLTRNEFAELKCCYNQQKL